MKRLPEIYPFLFAIYPVLFLASHNMNEVQLTDTILSAAAMLVFTLVLLLLSRLLSHDKEKSAIIVFIFLLMFFSFGHVQKAIRDFTIGDFVIGRTRYLLPIWILLLCGSIYFVARTCKNVSGLSKILSFFSVCLILLPAVKIGTYNLQKFQVKTQVSLQNTLDDENIRSEEQRGNHLQSKRKRVDLPETPLPDIYYIILDMYESSISLKERLGYSNDEFIDYLRNKGFYVAERSYSNYAQTYLSLASSLNMQYIHDMSDSSNIESKSLIPLAESIKDNKAYRFLRSLGYRYIHFKSRWGATRRHNQYADTNVGFVSIIEQNDFSEMLMNTTMLLPWYSHYRYTIFRKKDLYAFARLQEIPDIQGPKFVFVHVILPHPPFIFGPNGEEIAFPGDQLRNDRIRFGKYYVGQLTFLNKKLQLVINTILSKSIIPPIIVVQGDHGMGLSAEEEARGDYAKRMSILNAYYLPDNGKHLLYDSISPVNSFRLIFKHYFDVQYDLLVDRSFYSTYEQAFQFIEVPQAATSE